MQDPQLYKKLVQRYLNNTATAEELELFFHLLQQGALDGLLEEASLKDAGQPATPVVPMAGNIQRRSRAFIRYVVAASLVLALATLASLYLTRNAGAEKPVAQVTTAPQAEPGTKKATLVLSNGTSVALGANNQTIRDGQTAISAQNNNLVYEAATNTIATPKGGEYQVTLPDGTKVWLNAETSLRYPTIFTGPERTVDLTGEAYFEVAKNAAQPFIVRSGQATVKVLGTHFNIMAYKDEPFTKTTLAEGSVAMAGNGAQVILKPGQGGIISDGSNSVSVAAADVDLDLAWKNGQFYFNKTELSAIMKQLARWYDLEIRYAGQIPAKRFVGKISRYTNLSEVLDVLRLSGVKFSMTNKTLIVEE
jgi:transmembrane sensor